jgi:hypothetical protein
MRKTTLRSEWRSVLTKNLKEFKKGLKRMKKDLTGSALLEMDGYAN